MNIETKSEKEQKRIIDLEKMAEAAYNKNNFRWATELYWEIFAIDRNNHPEYLRKMILSSLMNKSLSKNEITFNISAFFSNINFYLNSLKIKSKEMNINNSYEIFESILKNDPHSVYAINILTSLYEKNGLFQQSAILLEFLSLHKKNDINLLSRLGDIYMQINDFEKAKNVFKKILKIKPFDQDSEKKMRDIMAMTSIDESKIRESGSLNNIKDKDYQYLAQLEIKINRSKDELDYLILAKEKQIEMNPQNITLRYELLKYYKDADDKLKILETIRSISALAIGDINVLMEKVDAEVSYFMEQSKIRIEKGEEENKIKNEMLIMKKNSYREIANNFSSNMEIKFKLAEVLFYLGEIEDSLKLFQICSKVSDLSAHSMNYMGKIFMHKQMLDLAEDQLKNAISQLNDMDEFKKDVIYNLGIVYEKQGKKIDALNQYKIIYSDDVAYKDVAKKIEDSYKIK